MRSLHHDNILSIIEILAPRSREYFDDLYLVTEAMDMDLRCVLRSKQELSLHHIKYFGYHIACALNYIHSANVIHRDLKPSNILVNINCDLKLCDFGLARTITDSRTILTDYMVTRYYRAPEILLECPYSYPIDMWSFGCIMIEFYLRSAFLCGKDSKDQLKHIRNKLGCPDDWDFLQNNIAKSYMQECEQEPKKDLLIYLPKDVDADFYDLLKHLLTWNPKERYTANEAMKHPFFSSVVEKEYESEGNAELVQFPDNMDFMSRQDLKDLAYREMCIYHPNKIEDTKRDGFGNNSNSNSKQNLAISTPLSDTTISSQEKSQVGNSIISEHNDRSDDIKITETASN